jgi:hypothetical protein
LNDETLPAEDLIPLVDIDTSIFDRIIQTLNIPVQATPLNIINLSLEREVNTLKGFKLLVNIPALNKKIKKAFSALIELEQVQFTRIEERIEKLRR